VAAPTPPTDPSPRVDPENAFGHGRHGKYGRNRIIPGLPLGVAALAHRVSVQPAVDGAPEALRQARVPGAGAPDAVVDLLAVAEIAAEQGGGRLGELHVVDLLVRFQIPAQVPAVLVARTDGCPVVDQ